MFYSTRDVESECIADFSTFKRGIKNDGFLEIHLHVDWRTRLGREEAAKASFKMLLKQQSLLVNFTQLVSIIVSPTVQR